MNFFKRVFKVGEAEAHSLVEKMEDPIKMTEQGIRDLKGDLDESLKALAEVKAMAIRSRNEITEQQEKSADYERKAMLLVQKAEKGEMSMEDADRLASEALVRKTECDQRVTRSKGDQEKFEGNVQQLEQNIKKLKSNVAAWENELKTLKARVKVSSATKNLNKQMAKIDSTDTVSLLERMKDKVNEEEALAEAYGDIANDARSLDEEIDKAIDVETDGADKLAELKRKMGLNEEK